MKKAVNFLEKNQIVREAEKGRTPEEVSYLLRVELDVIQAFWPKGVTKPKPAKKAEVVQDDILDGMGDAVA